MISTIESSVTNCAKWFVTPDTFVIEVFGCHRVHFILFRLFLLVKRTSIRIYFSLIDFKTSSTVKFSWYIGFSASSI